MSEQGDGPTRVRAPRIVVRYAKVRLEVARGPDAGAAIDLAGQPVRVGTADDNDLVLTDDSVSRHHCELEIPFATSASTTPRGTCQRNFPVSRLIAVNLPQGGAWQGSPF